MRDDGITLVELMVIVSIIGILVIVFGFSFEGWMGNYRIEGETKQIYSDLMDARSRAMTRNRVYFVRLETTQYAIYSDTNPAPDGNGTLEVASDNKVYEKILSNNYQLLGSAALPQTITFITRGLMLPELDIRIDNTIHPDYDCIRIFQSRIRMGKYDTGSSTCQEK